MDFWDLTKLLIRRWYVAVPAVLLASAATWYTARVVQPDYIATAYVQLLPPVKTESVTPAPVPAPGPRNPWLDLGIGALNTAATTTTKDRTFIDRLDREGYSPNVTLVEDYPEPIVTIEVVSRSAEQAIATGDLVVRHFNDTVATLQTDYGVGPDQMVTTRRLDRGENVEAAGGKVKRAVVAVAVAGLVMSVAISVLFDAIARRWTRRRGEKAEQCPSTDSTVAARSAAGTPIPAVSAPPAAAAPLHYEQRVAHGRPVPHGQTGQGQRVGESPLAVEYRSAARGEAPEKPSVVTTTDALSDATVVLPRTLAGIPVGEEHRGQRR